MLGCEVDEDVVEYWIGDCGDVGEFGLGVDGFCLCCVVEVWGD